MKYVELERHLIGGADAYLRQSACAMFKGLVSPEYADFNLSIISHGQGMSSVVDALSLYPVFDDVKVVVVPDVPDKISDQDKNLILSYVKEPNPQAILVLVGDTKSVTDFAKEGKLTYIDCGKLDENAIAMEVDKLLSVPPKKTIEKSALRALVEKTLGDMSRIVSEVTKLRSYSGEVITYQDVELMVAPDLEFAIYELTGAVSEKQAEKALEILDVKALYHVRRVSKNYTQMRLKQAVDYLHGLQYSILSGKRLEHTAVHDAVLTLLNI